MPGRRNGPASKQAIKEQPVKPEDAIRGHPIRHDFNLPRTVPPRANHKDTSGGWSPYLLAVGGSDDGDGHVTALNALANTGDEAHATVLVGHSTVPLDGLGVVVEAGVPVAAVGRSLHLGLPLAHAGLQVGDERLAAAVEGLLNRQVLWGGAFRVWCVRRK